MADTLRWTLSVAPTPERLGAAVTEALTELGQRAAYRGLDYGTLSISIGDVTREWRSNEPFRIELAVQVDTL